MILLIFLSLFVYTNQSITGFRILDILILIELFAIIILSIIFEKIYLNYKKMHF